MSSPKPPFALAPDPVVVAVMESINSIRWKPPRLKAIVPGNTLAKVVMRGLATEICATIVSSPRSEIIEFSCPPPAIGGLPLL